MRSGRVIRCAFLGLAAGFGCVTLSGQTAVDRETQKIDALLAEIHAHKDLKALLDPSLSYESRKEQSKHFAYDYKITLVREGAVQFSSQTATVPARLTFESSSATSHDEKEYSTQLSFVLQNGQWYFANYDFLNTSVLEIFAFGAAMLLAGGWAAGTLIKWRLLRKQRTGAPHISELISDYLQAVNPLTWFPKKPQATGE